MKLKPRLMATTLSGMPHKDPVRACEAVLHYFPEAPCIPRLTMSVRMYLEGMPCVAVDTERRTISLDLSREQELLEFYDDYEARRTARFAITPKWGPALYTLANMLQGTHGAEPSIVHFVIPGPFTWGLSIINNKSGIPSWYDDLARDIVVKTLSMKILWVEQFFRSVLPNTPMMITLGEPSLPIVGTAFGSFDRDELLNSINDVLSVVQGIGSVHCCGNIDWSFLMESATEVINFDAFRFSRELAFYTEELSKFLLRGGMLAWGIVPVDVDYLAAEDIESLIAKFEQGIQLLTSEGIDRVLLLESSFVTTSCETSLISTQQAEEAFRLTSEISKKMRGRYF